jgi:hypothetical protein
MCAKVTPPTTPSSIGPSKVEFSYASASIHGPPEVDELEVDELLELADELELEDELEELLELDDELDEDEDEDEELGVCLPVVPPQLERKIIITLKDNVLAKISCLKKFLFIVIVILPSIHDHHR